VAAKFQIIRYTRPLFSNGLVVCGPGQGTYETTPVAWKSLSDHIKDHQDPRYGSALIPTAFQELIHRTIHRCNWPDNRPRSLKILALQRKTRTIRRPCGLTAGILIYKNLND